jgi:DNA-binding transcriptional MerR regulator
MHAHTPLWTLDELTAQVALALAVDYDGQKSGRVRDVPDRRTIRYYTTLGLIDRPAALRGRTALYSRRHLLQLVAIKRLQAQGLSLAEIQARLVGRTEDDLHEVARVVIPDAEASKDGRPDERPREGTFWKATPALAEPEEETREAARPLIGVPLPGGVTLLWPAARPVEGPDLQAISAAAAPLIHLLRTRHLLDPDAEPPTKGETS